MQPGWPGRPASHCSPSSTIPLLQLGRVQVELHVASNPGSHSSLLESKQIKFPMKVEPSQFTVVSRTPLLQREEHVLRDLSHPKPSRTWHVPEHPPLTAAGSHYSSWDSLHRILPASSDPSHDPALSKTPFPHRGVHTDWTPIVEVH